MVGLRQGGEVASVVNMVEMNRGEEGFVLLVSSSGLAALETKGNAFQRCFF
jgi:hypothetical protein